MSAVTLGYNSESNALVAMVDGEAIGTVMVGDDAISAGVEADLNGFFILVSAYLVFFMQCGFAMLSVGSIRGKNAKNIILKNLLDACFGAIFFYLLGFGFAFGGHFEGTTKGNKFIGYEHFALSNLDSSNYPFWFFQFAFAATAATIVSGAVAERCRFEGYIAYAILLTSWVYPCVVHWVWSTTGWASAFRDSDKLFGVGVIDFAGCGVVHMVGGFAALAGAIAIGPRIGRFDADGKARSMPGHNASLAILGVFILWFGWFGFNPGSALAIIESSEVAALCAITTTLSAAAATVSSLLVLGMIDYVKHGHIVYDLIGASNGTLCGLVGITAACSVVQPWAAIIIGLISGVVYVGASHLVENILRVDDPLDAFAVHGCGGILGLIMAAVFADKDLTAAAYSSLIEDEPNGYGFIMGGSGKLLAAALVTIVAIIAWVLGHMLPFFFVFKAAGLLRVDPEEEMMGLDVSHHGGAAYESPEVDVHDQAKLQRRLDAMESKINKTSNGFGAADTPKRT